MGLNLAAIIRESAGRYPDEDAVLFDASRLTHRDLNDQAARLAGGMSSLGIRRGQHVALLLPNVPQFTVAYFAAHYLGVPVVPLNVMLAPDEIAYQLEDSDAAALIVWEGLLERAMKGCARAEGCRTVIVAGSERSSAVARPAPVTLVVLEDLIEASRPLAEPSDTMPDDTAVVLYTSGTTGRPKGAELTHANLYSNAEAVGRLLPLDESTVALAALPLSHSFGQTAVQNAVLMRGGCVVPMPRFDAGAAMAAMQRHSVTYFTGVPTMYFALLHHPEAGRYDLGSLRLCHSGGAAMPVEVMTAFDARYGVSVLEGYGLSETSPLASFNVRERPKRPGSIGIPIDGVEFRLVDDADRVIEEAMVPGEICIKGPNVMKGYYKRPEATAEAIRDGWFRTGDIARRDGDGYYYIVDRKKDMILRGGFNVYPREVEEILYAHPAVAEAAVVGVPHESLGEEVKAVVVARPGCAVTETEILDYCRERLAAYKCPRVVEVRDALPKGPTGKILKRELRG